MGLAYLQAQSSSQCEKNGYSDRLESFSRIHGLTPFSPGFLNNGLKRLFKSSQSLLVRPSVNLIPCLASPAHCRSGGHQAFPVLLDELREPK